ncbi:hypothetical protein CH25_gp35 [Mycobacterium phage EagleEye]|uniref:Uncharacterized protein n=1 Tax=Mycobacterium phage EagleEye TaxID=1429759 RepID=W0LJ85_9CAUD|nr:hypothetical protein CH25_gp35 [Mycobacterium phage EagleEye]AHG23851.1 hypothetical protein PBI_EAGLEEYE_71 [Mycobacterium phage EagleEye]QDK03504.1 hypothetical protein SEA_LUCYEDI_70 [Mycobacterium phage Lucyedi]QNJ55852.1 hypothetical protein SEA_PAINTERBOY_69 [Mycobacterium phage PainterBoy]
MKTLKERLIGVKGQLTEHGRNNKGYMKDPNGCLCLLGAVAAEVFGYDTVTDTGAQYGKLDHDLEARVVVEALAKQVRQRHQQYAVSDSSSVVFFFNDRTPVTENDEALALVDAAIEVAE